jgi:hypothetical protein
MEPQLKGQSGTILEQTTSPDGLVQLVPRKRKVGDTTEHNAGCKNPGLFAQNVAVPAIVGEADEDEFSRPGMSSGPQLAPVLDSTPTPVRDPENPPTHASAAGTPARSSRTNAES